MQAKPLVQRRVTGDVGGSSMAPPIVHEVLRSPGRPLDPATRAFMESRFSHDFSQVRVHSGLLAAASAQAVNARAYTVGQDIVFGAGQYRPGTSAGRQLIAHELTHVLQQQEGGTTGAHPPAIQRDGPAVGGGATTTSEQERANNAELFCDILELCRLHASVPTVMTDERLRAAIGRCRPGVPLIGNPCLQPNIIVPAMGAAGQVPGAAPTRPAAGPQPAQPSPGGLNLSELTEFQFNLGPIAFNVSLPSSLRARLPVPLRGARRIVFSLEARTSGAFSFSATLDGLPHIRVAATAGVDVAGRTASAGLTFTTTRTVCRVTDPATARTKIEAAGRKLQTAVNNLQNPPTPAPGAEAPGTFDQLTEIASAISDMYKAIESMKGPCREVPRATLQFGVRTPIDIGTESPGERERRPAPFIGGTLTIPF